MMIVVISLVEVNVMEAVLLLVVVGRNSHIVAIHVGEVFIGMFHTHHLVLLKFNRSGLAQYLFVDDALEAVVEDAHFFAFAEGIFAKQSARSPLQALLADDLAAE